MWRKILLNKICRMYLKVSIKNKKIRNKKFVKVRNFEIIYTYM